MCKNYVRAREKVFKYFRTHPNYSAWAHLLAGIGFGILITYPLVGMHPLRWGTAILVVALVAFLYPLIAGN